MRDLAVVQGIVDEPAFLLGHHEALVAQDAQVLGRDGLLELERGIYPVDVDPSVVVDEGEEPEAERMREAAQ